MNYEIIKDPGELENFINNFLPNLEANEVFYLSLFARSKYSKDYKADNQLVRFTSNKEDLYEKIRRLEAPIGSFVRDGIAVPQEALALYITINPRSIIKANKNLLVELATLCADGKFNVSPISLATTAVHNALSRKIFIDFDYDSKDVNILKEVFNILPAGTYKSLETKGGYHVLATLDLIKHVPDWYKRMAALPNCDVKGSNTLTPVPGCTQGDYCPHFVKLYEQLAKEK